MIDYLYFFIYKFFTILAKILPRGVMDLLLKWLSKFVYRIDRKHNHIINANLNLAFGDTFSQKERDNIGERTFYNLLQTIIGFVGRERRNKAEILKCIKYKNGDILQEAITRGEKVILVTGHYSNWELLAPAISLKFNVNIVGVGRKLDSPLMDRLLKKNREQFGVEMIYRKGAIKGTIKALREGKIVGLLLDQHLGAKQGGIEVSFFNHKVLHSPIASILARSLDATLLPSYISTDDYINYIVTFYKPIKADMNIDKKVDIKNMTQAQANIMESVIRKRPGEWFWVHKRWKGFYSEIYEEVR
jgi:KDO2-lipid IV(A) lauroyltransferase